MPLVDEIFVEELRSLKLYVPRLACNSLLWVDDWGGCIPVYLQVTQSWGHVNRAQRPHRHIPNLTAKTGYVAHLHIEERWPYYGCIVFSAVVTFHASIFQSGIGKGLLRGGGGRRVGILVGKLKLNPKGRRLWVWLKLKLAPKLDHTKRDDITAFFL